MIDAGLTDVSAAYSRKYFEVQKYGTVAPFFTVYFHLYVNPAWFEQAARPRIARRSPGRGGQGRAGAIPMTEATGRGGRPALKAKGMTLHIQTPAEQQAWKAVMQKPVVEAFLKTAPRRGAKIIELLGSSRPPARRSRHAGSRRRDDRDAAVPGWRPAR